MGTRAPSIHGSETLELRESVEDDARRGVRLWSGSGSALHHQEPTVGRDVICADESRHDDLDFHHHDSLGKRGDHRPENIALMCRTHNALLAEQDYGKEVMGRFSRSSNRVSCPLTTPHRET